MDKSKTPMSTTRPSSYNKAAKLFSRFPHLKKFGPKQGKKADEQQSNQEMLIKMHSVDDKVPDFSAYTKKVGYSSWGIS